MPDALTLYTGDMLGRSRHWSNLEAGERKRRAAEACSTRDIAALWDLTLSYWMLFGAAGARVSPNSIAAYKRGVSVFVTDTARSGHSIMRFPRDGAAVWVREQESAGLKTSTIQVRLAAARMLYKALRWAGVVDTDPLADIKPSRDPTPAWEKRSPYTQTELDAMLAVASDVDRALILLGSHSGLRVSECVALKWEHVNLDTGQLVVVEGKGGKTAAVTMSRSVVETLSSLPRDSEYVLPYRTRQTASQRMRSVCQAAGTKYRAIHSLRHAAGTRLYASTRDILAAQRHLRHSSSATTTGYVHWSNDQLRDSVGNW